MANTFDIFECDQSGTALIEALLLDDAATERSALISHLHQLVENDRVALQRHTDDLDKLYEEVVRGGLGPHDLAKLVKAAVAREHAVAERSLPETEWLHRALVTNPAARDPEVRRSLEDRVEIISRRLALYRTLRDKLVALAAERVGSSNKVLRARPVEGKIDHAELTREIISRFPKILSELAK
jgi:hypothetical protein